MQSFYICVHALDRFKTRFPHLCINQKPEQVIRDRMSNAVKLSFHKQPYWQEFYAERYNGDEELTMYLDGFLLFVFREHRLVTICDAFRMSKMRNAIQTELKEKRILAIKNNPVITLDSRDKYHSDIVINTAKPRRTTPAVMPLKMNKERHYNFNL